MPSCLKVSVILETLECKIIMIDKTISNYKILEKLGIGGVLLEMWLLVKSLISNFLVVSSREVAAAFHHLMELNRKHRFGRSRPCRNGWQWQGCLCGVERHHRFLKADEIYCWRS